MGTAPSTIYRKPVHKNKAQMAGWMRRHPTKYERIAREYLEMRHLKDNWPRVQWQVILYGYIADGFIRSAGIIIEIDGKIHDSEDNRKYDEARTSHLEKHGLKVYRVTNEEVRLDVEAAFRRLEKILVEKDLLIRLPKVPLPEPEFRRTVAPLAYKPPIGVPTQIERRNRRLDEIKFPKKCKICGSEFLGGSRSDYCTAECTMEAYHVAPRRSGTLLATE